MAGEVRNPEKYCHAMRTDGVTPCSNYALRDQRVCRFHGGATSQVANKKAKEQIAAAITMFDLPAPVEQKDFAEIAGQYVSVANTQVAALLDNLRTITAEMDPVTVAREFGDVLDRISALSKEAARMMEMANGLKQAAPPPAPPKPPSTERMRMELEGVKARMIAGGILGGGPPHVCPPCTNCGAEILAFPAPDFI